MFDQIDDLQIYRGPKGPTRNKPLLVLQAIGDVLKGKGRLQPFVELEKVSKEALERFGLTKVGANPAYAFHRLQADGIWEVVADAPLVPRQSNTDPAISELRRKNARGGFTSECYTALINDPALVKQVVNRVLKRYIPSQLHDEVRQFFLLP